MISLINSIILSIIQGITEWFPVSSSGHLAIFQKVFGFQSLPFDVFLHFASILAVIIIFWKDLVNIFDTSKKENVRYLLLLIIAIIPAGIVGVLFKDSIEGFFSNTLFLGFFFFVSGILIYSTKFGPIRNGDNKKITFFDSLFIGLFQIIAIFPGISRSGTTISAGLFRGIDKTEAVKFSFLLAVPLILGASILEVRDIILLDINYTILIISFLVTFLTSLIAIKFLLKIVHNDKFYWFGIYDMFLGILVLVWSLI